MARTIYIFHQGKLVEKSEEMTEKALKAPFVLSDLPGYISPVGSGYIEGRSQRREDLKRSGCREVDSSEFKRKG